ncbi:MAG TPA: enolase C-terminal domain-like protein [Bryobacteraceae bacterium]|jgi:glucarate dehydratase|nr:enolase C-terminal domain-like protein [Bryobacteraceae bacterium]
MRITDMRLHPIAIADPPLRSSYGLHAPFALRTIVELKTDDGLTGISETYGGDGPLAGLEGVRGRVIGMDPFQLASLYRDLAAEAERQTADAPGGRTQTYLVPGENPLDRHTRTYAAIEIACLDLIGKAVGKPVCDVIGGRVRDAVPFSAYLFYKHGGGGGVGDDAREDEYGEVLDAQAAVRECRQMIAKYGFHEIKLKGGVLDPEVEVATIRALREEFGPSYPLRIDPNCAWSVETSVEVGRALREELADGGYLEDPCATLEGMGEVRRRLLAEGIDTPQGSNVAVTCFADVPRAARLDAVQIVLSDPHYWGGMRQVQYLSHLSGVLGMGLSMHSNSHLGVSLMAMTHVAAACPNLTFACDTHYPWQTERDEVAEGGRIPIAGGAVRIPDKPGLGVSLDYDQLARGRERYEKIPFRKRDDEAEMRKHVDPQWKRILPRW